MVGRYLRDGDDDAFRSLYVAYSPILLRRFRTKWGFSADASEDAVQETFLHGMKNMQKLEDRAKFGAWLTTIADRQAMAVLSSRNTGTAEVLAGDAGEAEGRGTRSAVDVETDLVDSLVLRRAVDALPAQLKDVVRLCYYEDYTFEEAGFMLGCSSSTAHGLLSVARKRLSLQLAAFNHAAIAESRPVKPTTRRDQAMAQLSPRRREVLDRHVRRGMKPVDIAKDLGITPGCARVHLHLAYRELAKLLGIPDYRDLIVKIKNSVA